MSTVIVNDLIKKLDLEFISGTEPAKSKKIPVPEIKRLGIELVGYFDHFASERIMVLGRTELAFLKELSSEQRILRLKQLFYHDIPCVIVAHDMIVSKELQNISNERKVPILRSKFSTSFVIKQVLDFLEEQLLPKVAKHGVLVEVYGTGVLLLGESGVGKSECCLELIKRGHRLVADDVVNIRGDSKGQLIGSPTELVKHHLEIRGLGIINIKSLFGIGAICDEKVIELVIQLELYKEDKEYERVGVNQEFSTILNVDVPMITIPVKEGKNISVIVEVAAMNQHLKMQGEDSASDFVNNISRKIMEL